MTAVRGPRAAGPTVLPQVDAVGAPGFGRELARRLAAPGGRLLYLTRIAGLPGASGAGSGAGADHLLALYDGPDGPAALAAPCGDRPRRPSAEGVLVAWPYERYLERHGLPWADPLPVPPVAGRGVFTFPLGPVRGDVAESAAWRLDIMGDEVLGLRLGFGYKSRDYEAQMSAAPAGLALPLAERVTGTSPVAHGVAYAMACEAAFGLGAPPAAVHWRGVMAEIERLYSHLGDLAALANSTGLPAAGAELYILKESILRLCWRSTGHRYQRGAVAVGGLTARPSEAALAAGLREVGARFDGVVAALDGSTSFLDRLHTAGRVPPDAAAAWRPVGPVGRACGIDQDTRRDDPYGAYAGAGAPPVALAESADAFARYRVRVDEVRASSHWLLERLAAGDPGGSVAASLGGAPVASAATVIGFARVEGPRGELIYVVGPGWVRTRTASALNWAVVSPAVSRGNVMQDVPIVDASFALCVSGLDL